MTVELIGIAGMSNELKQTYDRVLLSIAQQNLVYANYGLKKSIPARGGKSIEWRRFEKIAVAAGNHVLTEGTSPASTQATISNVTATISQYGAYSQISDLLETQAFDPIIAEYSEKYGIHMGETLDTVVRDTLVGGTTVQYASTAGSRFMVGSGMYLNAAELREAKRTLARQNAKPVVDGKYVCVIHPDNTKDLFADADIVNAFQQAGPRGPNNPLFTGELGDWNGIRFVETTQVLTYGSGLSAANVYQVLMFGKEAYAVTDLDSLQSRLIVHPRGSGGHTDPLEQYSTIGWKAALAATILNQNWMVRIECNSSFATSN